MVWFGLVFSMNRWFGLVSRPRNRTETTNLFKPKPLELKPFKPNNYKNFQAQLGSKDLQNSEAGYISD